MKKLRENKYAAVRRMLEDNMETRAKSEEKFQMFFQREVQNLNNQVIKETEV
jgi:hypothetical protein